MDETSGCGARRELNARERSGDATSGDERRRGEARAKPVERGKSEAQVRDFGSLEKRHFSPRPSARERQEPCCRLTDLPVSAKLDFCSSCAWMRAELTNGHGH